MKASAYLKARLESERKLAIALDKGVTATPGVVGKTISDIYSGIERASWYSSCFFEQYQDVCKELGREDVRMVLAIVELYKRKDVIVDIFELYVNYTLKHPDNLIMEILLKHSGTIISGVTVSKTINDMLAYSIAKGIAESTLISASVRKNINKVSSLAIVVIQYYGKNHKAALAARRLRMIDPGFYNILYRLNIEMLYIFIEPVLSKIINEIKYQSSRDKINTISK